jgi:hypothetical protein
VAGTGAPKLEYEPPPPLPHFGGILDLSFGGKSENRNKKKGYKKFLSKKNIYGN